jgi:hypothetical protein
MINREWTRMNANNSLVVRLHWQPMRCRCLKLGVAGLTAGEGGAAYNSFLFAFIRVHSRLLNLVSIRGLT